MIKRFYVYLIEDYDGTPKYVGKGSGDRVFNQWRRFGGVYSILSRHTVESDAYAEEVVQIAKLHPYRNKHPGGAGGIATKRRASRKQAWEIEMLATGTREYVRRLLITFGKTFMDVESYESLKNEGSIQCRL